VTEPAPGSTEWQAQQLARSLSAQDKALETLRLQAATKVESFDADRAAKRAQYLAVALNAAPARRLGKTVDGEIVGLPNGGLARVTWLEEESGDGPVKTLIRRLAPVEFDGELILPHQWEEHDELWYGHQRRSDNRVLADNYGIETCLAEDLFSEEEAAELGSEGA
jgi:hypothetical protein